MKLQLNYPFYLDEYMSNVEADLEFNKAIDVQSHAMCPYLNFYVLCIN